MSAPWFKLKGLGRQHGIIALSSNYLLYAHVSNCVMSIFREYSPNQEVYLIDESFLYLTGFKTRDLIRYGQHMRKRILRWTCLAPCVSIRATKTLAKIANHCAKKKPQFNNACNFNTMSEVDLDYKH